MLDILTKFSTKKTSFKKKIEKIEPHVECFMADVKEQNRFTLPFYLITATLTITLCLAFYFWLTTGDKMMIEVSVWLHILFAPFYIPGIYYYSCYFEKDKHTEVEVDKKNELIKYSSKGVNLLFHKSQVEKCEINLSLLFPYRLDYISLQLAGGRKIYISNLIIDPKTMVRWFKVKPSIQRRYFNSMPVTK